LLVPRPPAEKKMGLISQKKVTGTLLSLSQSVQELTEENQSLKEDLDRILSTSPTASKIKGYMEWSKPRLLRRIAELEKISSVESPEPHTSEVVVSNPPAQSASSSAVDGQPRSNHQEGSERLRGALRSLKAERSALQAQLQERNLEVKQLLQTKADLQKELENVKENEKERRAREEALRRVVPRAGSELSSFPFHPREEIQTLNKKFQELEGNKKEKKDESAELTSEVRLSRGSCSGGWGPQLTLAVLTLLGFPTSSTDEPIPLIIVTSCEVCTPEPWPSHPASRPSLQDSGPDTGEEGTPRTPSSCSDRRRDAAARILQARWKVYKHKKKKADLDEAAAALQAAFRGHLARAKLLSSNAHGSRTPGLPNQSSPVPCVPSPIAQAKDDARQEEAITMIQSVFRAHLLRTRHSTTRQRHAASAPAKRTGAPATPSQPCSLPFPAACPGKEDSEGSSRETAKGPATEDETLRLWGPRRLAAPRPCLAEPAPSGLQPPVSPPTEDVISDDSDEIVVAPALPARNSASRS
ncbi:hypothetical protein MC885_007354, partial [Smutsia gigantea]